VTAHGFLTARAVPSDGLRYNFSMRGHGNLVGFLNDTGHTVTLSP
jgi:hypothetical protein